MQKCGDLVDKPTRYTVDGETREADLCPPKHKPLLLQALEPFNAIATPVESSDTGRVRAAVRGKKGPFTTKQVRDWAQAMGKPVADSGRLPNSLLKEYEASHTAS